jgi:F0F1-type ATP synthase assembly protein I
MPKVITVIEDRFKFRRPEKRNIYFKWLVVMANFISGFMLPFVIGYYTAKTRNLFFFILFLILIFIDIQFSYTNNVLRVSIARWW